jgi:small subunit ribosomal protein S4
MEKQKAKYTYGILEKQFSNLFKKASSKQGITGEILLQLCEARLDNTVFRMGIAPTRRGARQLVSHRHITVNGNVTNIPSYTLRPGDVVGVRERSKSLEAITDSLSRPNTKWDWLNWNDDTMTGEVLAQPEREQIPENIKEQLIVELYSK